MFWNNRKFWIKIYELRKFINSIKCKICKIEIENTAESVGKALYIGGVSKVTRHTIIGDHVSFNGMNISGSGTVRIGKSFHSGENCYIITQSHNYDKGTIIPYDFVNISKDVTIGDFVWIGANVTILPGCIIEEGAIVQAGSVCHGTIPAYSIVGGNPAKIFKYRNIEHFKKLKMENKFLH